MDRVANFNHALRSLMTGFPSKVTTHYELVASGGL